MYFFECLEPLPGFIISKMKQLTNEDRKGIDNCLRFVVKEVEKRVTNALEDKSAVNLDLLDKDMHSYSCIKEVARQAGVNSKKYNRQIDQLRKRLKEYDIKT